MEAVAETGSISATGLALGLSYRCASGLLEELNRGGEQPTVATSLGGRDGGGTSLTPVH